MRPNVIEPHTLANIAEARNQHLLRTGVAKAIFLQGVFPFAGRGFFSTHTLSDSLVYEVPAGCRSEVVYFRGGNLSDDLVYVTITANGKPIRYFPMSPKGDIHVPLVITESHPAGTKIEIGFAASRALTGNIVVDAGILQFPDSA